MPRPRFRHPPALRDPELKVLPIKDYANYLKPIEAPLVFSGFWQETMQRFGPQFARAGIVPVMGVGSVSGGKQPEPLEPGSASARFWCAVTCTLRRPARSPTVDAQRLLACGHPLLQFGMVDLPMTKAEVLAHAAFSAQRFQDRKRHRTRGRFRAGPPYRHPGRVWQTARMIPVTLNIHSGAANKQFHYEVLNKRQPEPAGHDGYGVQRVTRGERVR